MKCSRVLLDTRVRGCDGGYARVLWGIPLRSLRSASPFAERKGTIDVDPSLLLSIFWASLAAPPSILERGRLYHWR